MASTKPKRSPPVWYHALRAAGLRLVARIPIWGQKQWVGPEKPKIVIRDSLPFAIAQTAVHLVPTIISSFVIFLNIYGFYLGMKVPGPDMSASITNTIFQVVAKLQELLIVGSLTAIVLSHIRHELLNGDGVPLGFLCSSFNFASISYFWSEEFWGGVRSGGVRKRKKALSILILVASGGIAAFAGPAVAVLLIPRQQPWDGGATDFYLRGTMNEIYPAKMVADEAASYPACSGSDAINFGICPSGGYYSLFLFTYRIPKVENGFNLPPLREVIFGIFDTQVVDIAASTSSMPPSQLWGSIRGVACQTSAIGSFIPVTMFQGYLSMNWGLLAGDKSDNSPSIGTWSESKYKYYFNKTLETRAKVPAVRVACAAAENLGEKDTSVKFPVIPEFACPVESETKPFEVPSLPTKKSNELQVTWTPLPSDFGSTSTGMVFQAPWGRDGTRVVVGCSVDARWAEGNLDGLKGEPTKMAPSNQWGRRSNLDSPFRPKNDGSWTRITLDQSWLNKLTPEISTPKSKDPLNTAEAILSNSAILDDLKDAKDQAALWNNKKDGLQNRTIYLEWVTAMIVTDGLSRHGLETAINTKAQLPNWKLRDYSLKKDFDSLILAKKPALNPPEGTYTTFRWKITLSGLNYKITDAPDAIFVGVLLAHIFLALAHSVRLIQKHRSSEAWDSVTEILTLAYNSFPTGKGLRNTSSGIRNIQTYERIAIVRSNGLVETDEDALEQADGQVELLFTGTGESSVVPDEENPLQDNPTASMSGLSPGEVTGIEMDARSAISSSSRVPLIKEQSQTLSQGSGLRVRRPNLTGTYETVKPDRFYS